MDAWCLVYNQYLKSTLINSNRLSVFTFPEYISNNAAVITGSKMGHTVCTASAVLDSDKGLPLDAYYRSELDSLRRSGSKLIEIGLLADARGSRNVQEILELLQCVARFGVYSDHHDFVIGVNPRRLNFFREVFGFRPYGEARGYDKLKAAPVVLLYAHGKELEVIAKEANSKIYYGDTNLDFEHRYRFNPGNFIGPGEFSTTVETFIRKVWNSATLQKAS
jgi:hypothetical protein